MLLLAVKLASLILLTKTEVRSDTQCPPSWFDCGNNKCISEIWVCDGFNDCGNLKDEQSCDEQTFVYFTSPFTVVENQKPPARCLSSQFECHSDRHCIQDKWQCDGEKDCDDGSDEIGCNNITEECPGFACRDHHCIPYKWHCDGYADCKDGSDEEMCAPGKLCADTEFLCSSGSCINNSRVCDGKKDCPDGTDEGSHCDDPCENSTCSQNCRSTPFGPQCFCNDGYELDPKNNKTCLDVDECLQEGFCSHQCTNAPGSYRCSCRDGYELVNRTCQAAGADPLLVFSTLQEIRGMNLRTNKYFLICRALSKATAVDVDPKSQRVYWVEVNSKSSIYSTKTDGSDFSFILSHGLHVPEDIAVDYVANNLYLTDSGLRQVLVCKMDGTMCHVLHDQNVERPRSIVLDPAEGFLYWSDWGEHSSGIYRSGMDGSRRIPFVSSRIAWPNGIAVDHSTNRLYWADAKLNTIEYMSLDGNSRKVILNGTVFHPYSLSVFEDTIYWTDWSRFSLESCNKFTGHKMTLMARENGRHIMGVHVYHPILTVRVSNPCWSNDCSHMCLISPGSGYSCACPHGFELGRDGKTCSNDLCENATCSQNCRSTPSVPQCFCNDGYELDPKNNKTCLARRCEENDFKCMSGQCLPNKLRCDGSKDCEDGSDEVGCNPCSGDDFNCRNGNCILKSLKCDRRNDCGDNSDEQNCSSLAACASDQVACLNGKCVSVLSLCDGERDCEDGTDEVNCNAIRCDLESQYRCDSGQCIPVSWVCDQSKDCLDNSDEKNCTNKVPVCTPHEFKCESDGHCIDELLKCDGSSDCVDGSDEKNCPTRRCEANDFKCLSGQCLPNELRCDGSKDCEDGSDEVGCNPCSGDDFHCRNGNCILKSLKCDRRNDCGDNSDEEYCSEYS